MKVVYTGGGSSKGRKDFAQSSTDFAISEIPYQGTDEQGNADTSNGREYAYLPIVAGGTAFTYQLKIGDQLVRNLRLSGETITKIFTNEIENWNDPAITADNNGRAFPSLPITPVVRSDGSGTTAQFTTWMDKEYPSLWRAFYGKSGLTSYYPRKGRAIGQAGSDQVMNTIAGFAGNGTIGYVEYSYPVNKDYPVVKVLNKGGFYVEPTQYNVAVALTKAKINTDKSSPLYLTQILDEVYRHPDPRAYPVSSYSYMVIPTGASDQRMTTAKRQTLGDFMYYSLCAGQTKAGPYGYSPLPLNLVQAGFEQIAKLKAADPAVDLTDRDVDPVQQPHVRRQEPVEEQAGRDRAAAGRLRQGRRGAVRHRHRHGRAVHRRRGGARTSPSRRLVRRRARWIPRPALPQRRSTAPRPWSTRPPARSSPRPAPRRPAGRPPTSRRPPSSPRAARPTPPCSAGSRRSSSSRWCSLPGVLVSSFRRRRPQGGAS